MFTSFCLTIPDPAPDVVDDGAAPTGGDGGQHPEDERHVDGQSAGGGVAPRAPPQLGGAGGG